MNKLYKIWLYILYKIYNSINNRIMQDKDNLYIVYYSELINDVYICENGQEALELVDLLNKLNNKLNRTGIKILYGQVKVVYKYKIAKLMNITFTFNISDEKRQEVYRYISDIPLNIN